MNRRKFIKMGCLTFFMLGVRFSLNAQLSPLALRLVRRTGWAELIQRSRCVIGDLYSSSQAFPTSDLGRKLFNVLELPWRNNLEQISSIPEGLYEGSVRIDGKLGWRIELTGTGDRKNIQIHVGNTPDNTRGCLLPGTGNSTDTSCSISGSGDAMKILRAEFGDAPGRPVLLMVQN